MWERRCGRGNAGRLTAPRRQSDGRSTQKRKSHGDSETQSEILLCVSVSPWLFCDCVRLFPCLRPLTPDLEREAHHELHDPHEAGLEVV